MVHHCLGSPGSGACVGAVVRVAMGGCEGSGAVTSTCGMVAAHTTAAEYLSYYQ